MVVEPPVVQAEAHNVKGQKQKTKGKAFLSTQQVREEEPVFSPTPIVSIPPIDTPQEATQGTKPLIYNFYLPWVDYTKRRMLLEKELPQLLKKVSITLRVLRKKSAGVSGNDVLEAGNVDVSHADIVTESVKSSSIKDLSKAVDPSEEHY
ncbi:hypothetical protein LIER_30326 [Lithospermum erythrorhizon]|uniref:Uncharacterized protein n=1 Tax=Lithospermum erythrorhizon TaxID=34254 RepID=A0AAV3RQC7_LITER